MKKVAWIIGAIVVIAALIVGGVWWFNKDDGDNTTKDNSTAKTEQQETPKKTEQSKEEPKDLTVDSAISNMKDEGLKVSAKQGAYYQMIGATDGDKVDANGTNVEMYAFDSAKKTQDAQKELSGDDVTIFTVGNFLVMVHSTDSATVQPIETAIKG